MMRLKASELPILVLSIVIPLLAGGLGSFATASAIPTWYQGLNKPSWTPPSWLFAPAWTLLFILMGIALFLVLRRGWSAPGTKTALTLFGLQLIFNVLWSVVFFGLRQPGWAVVEIIVLWLLILSTLVSFWGLVRASGLLLIPYLAWVTFATALTTSIWQLNR